MSNNLIEFDLDFVDAVVIGGGADDDGSYDDGYNDGKNAGFAEGEAFGKQNAPTENLDIALTSNGSYSYPKPTDKYYADVAVTVNVPSEKTPTQEKSVTITKNGTEVISPDEGYALDKVTVTTNIDTRLPEQTKEVTITENGTTDISPDDGYTLAGVSVTTQIDTRLPEQEKSLEVTENKVYEVVPDSGYALKKVTVTGNVASSGGGDDDGQIAKFKGVSTKPNLSSNSKISNLYMFISEIDLSKNVGSESYAYLFAHCPKSSIGLSKINTSGVTNFQGMFYESSYVSLDVSSFDMSSATYISSMFGYCNKLENIDISMWDTHNVTDMSSMFANNTNLKTVNMANIDVSKVSVMSYMFSSDSRLTSVNMEGLNPSKVTQTAGMFTNCSRLTSLDFSSWDTSALSISTQMLYGCTSLENVVFGNNWMSNKDCLGFDIYHSPLSKASILDLANKIADRSDTSIYKNAISVYLKSSQKSLFTDDELTALANQFTAKNWTLAWS